MNLAATAPIWLFLLLLVALVAAAAEDLARLRISSYTSLAVAFGALVAASIAGSSVSAWQNIAICLILLGLGTLAFAGGYLGGGDVKLFAALGLWMSISGGIWMIAAIFLAGGALALAILVARRLRRTTGSAKSGSRIPYGVAIAAGAAIIFQAQRANQAARAHSLPPIVNFTAHQPASN